jgi:carbon monoxide dehydrogenase subunit G
MWTHEESIEIDAAPAQIWTLLSNVAGWKKWNAGIESIQLHGPFVAGTTFSMKPPGEEAFTSTLVDVRENENFTDETIIDGTRVVVRHKIAALPAGGSRVTYSTEIFGPAAAQFGPLVTGDFPAVLSALKRLAENSK